MTMSMSTDEARHLHLLALCANSPAEAYRYLTAALVALPDLSLYIAEHLAKGKHTDPAFRDTLREHTTTRALIQGELDRIKACLPHHSMPA